MPKDIQGVLRGKCNEDCCDCEEYYPPSDGRGLKCEYCDHVPARHVRIIPLGACRKCGKDDCDKYVPEKETSYSECQYCGCDASLHEGAEALRKTPTTPQGPPQAFTGPPMSMPASFQPRVHQGQPVQTNAYGTCAYPGCPYPRRVEGSRVHDYCSRTCSRKAAQLLPPPSSAAPPAGYSVVTSTGVLRVVSPPHHHHQGSAQPKPAAGPTAAVASTSQATAKPRVPADKTLIPTPSADSGPPLLPSNAAPPAPQRTFPIATGPNTCRRCGLNPANAGHSWCQTCYVNNG